MAFELLTGGGAVLFEDVLDKAVVQDLRMLLERTPYESDGSRDRFWGLLKFDDGGLKFAIQHPEMLLVLEKVLGKRCILGSAAGIRTRPGRPGQEPHIDYPYWDYYNADDYPLGFKSDYALNIQVTIPLDPFTADTGATQYVPKSQLSLEFPPLESEFEERAVPMLAKPGDALMFNGACWHRAGPNRSDKMRSAILLQYLPKFVKPMENLIDQIGPSVLAEESEVFRRLLGAKGPGRKRGVDLPANSAEWPQPRTQIPTSERAWLVE